jgi:hypothetical protein
MNNPGKQKLSHKKNQTRRDATSPPVRINPAGETNARRFGLVNKYACNFKDIFSPPAN